MAIAGATRPIRDRVFSWLRRRQWSRTTVWPGLCASDLKLESEHEYKQVVEAFREAVRRGKLEHYGGTNYVTIPVTS